MHKNRTHIRDAIIPNEFVELKPIRLSNKENGLTYSCCSQAESYQSYKHNSLENFDGLLPINMRKILLYKQLQAS